MNNKLYRNYEIFMTIVVPCRGRHQKTIDLLQSIENTTYDKNQITVITITDWDVPEDMLNIQKYENNLSYNLINLTRQQDVKLISNYINFATLMSESYYVWALCNDIEIITPEWDRKLQERLSHTSQHIANNTQDYYIHINGFYLC